MAGKKTFVAEQSTDGIMQQSEHPLVAEKRDRSPQEDIVRVRLDFGNGPQRCGCVIRNVNGQEYAIYVDTWREMPRADAKRFQELEPALKIEEF